MGAGFAVLETPDVANVCSLGDVPRSRNKQEFEAMDKVKKMVGIINVTGYTGVEVARRLYRHPEVELTSVTGRSAVGEK